MATSQTVIANMALGHLAAGFIASMTDRSAEAIAVNTFYDVALQTTLRAWNWPFAKVNVALGLVATLAPGPSAGNPLPIFPQYELGPPLGILGNQPSTWCFSYRVPADCVAFRKILSGLSVDTRQSRVPYNIGSDSGGELVFTNMANSQGEYTQLQCDVNRFPSDFTLALSYKLGMLMAPKLTAGDPFKLGDKCASNYQIAISMAQAAAANEQQQFEDPQSEFIRGRN